jgi:UDP-glucose 4-epimerase|tara:strand:+ start:592 stop:1566 length:975 start_codon:yes stop_codon:yes gene_type:complete
MKKIFITGGAGFIANTIIKRLIETHEITVYDNFERDTLSSSGLGEHTNLTIIRGDILDYEKLYSSMKEGGCPDIVIHAAAIAGIDTVVKHPVKTMRVNMIGTANVLEVCKELGISDRIIEFSTSEVFGSMAFKSKEEDQTVAGSAGEARWVYAVSKLAGEHLAKAYGKEYNLPIVTIRPFNVYGPGQSANGALQIFIEKALRGEDLHIDGDGNQIRAWCYVDDFVDCLMSCITNPKAIGESFNIGNPRAVITILGLAQTICRVLDSKSKILFDPPLSADVAIRIPSVEKAKEVLGFSSKIDLEEGILKTAKYIKDKWKVTEMVN